MPIIRNYVKIDGDNNIVYQDVDGEAIKLSITEFIEKFTSEKDARIRVLERSINDKEQIQELTADKIRKLSEELEQLHHDKIILENQVNKMLHDFAGKDLSTAGALYQKAVSLFFEAKLKEAIAVLDDAVLDEQLRQIELQEQKNRDAKSKLAEAFTLKANMLKLSFRLNEAEQNHEKAIQISPSCTTYLNAAKFYQFIKELEKAEASGRKAFEHANTVGELAEILYQMANIIRDQYRYEQAESLYLKCLEYQKGFAKSSFQARLQVAITLNDLGSLRIAQHDFEKAEEHLREAADTLSDLTKHTQPQAPNGTHLDVILKFIPYHADVQNNLGSLYHRKGDFAEAAQIYHIAYLLIRKSASLNPNEYLFKLGEVLNNYGDSLYNMEFFKEAGEAFEEGLIINRKMSSLNPRPGLPQLARTLRGIALVKANIKDLQGSISILEETLATWRRLDILFSGQYKLLVAGCLIDLAVINENANEFDRAIQNLQEAIPIYRQFMAVSDSVSTALANALKLLGVIQLKIKDLGSACANLEEAAKLYRQYTAKASDKELSELASTINHIGHYYLSKGDLQQALNQYTEALIIQRNLAQSNPTKYLPHVSVTLVNIAVQEVDRQKGIAMVREAVALVAPLSNGNPNANEVLKVAIGNLLALDKDARAFLDALQPVQKRPDM